MLTLNQARTIAEATLAEGRKLNLAPLAVAVLDRGGNLLVFLREEDAGILRFDIAFAKAWGSLGMGFGSRELTQRAARMPEFFQALAAASHGRMAPSPGGVLVADTSGKIIGAVGASGDKGDMDEKCVLAGIAAAGLTAVQ